MSDGDLVVRPGSATPTPDAIRTQIERILASDTFKNAGRLSRFLRYVAEQTASGASRDIKEYPIGVEVFERGPEFDPRSDSVVRVEARRLRSKLRDYYELEGMADPVAVSIPKGSYIPVFEAAAPTVEPRGWRPSREARLLAAAAGLLVVVAVVGWFGWRPAVATPIVAILPLENLSAEAGNEYFCHSVADQIAAALGQDRQVRVITRSAAGPLGARADLAQITGPLKARFVIEGSVVFAGDRARVTVMLVELNGFTNVWLETFDRDVHDRLAVESELAATVASKVRPYLR